MKKHQYRTISFDDINTQTLHDALIPHQRVILGLDIAKHKPVMQIRAAGQPILCFSWQHPTQTREVVQSLSNLPVARIEVAMEPSGTYQEPIVRMFRLAGILVFRVSPNLVSKSGELYDGVCSKHDPKDAAVISYLHELGRSVPWPQIDPEVRNHRALLKQIEFYSEPFQRALNNLEALLARYWPELPHLMDLERVTLLELLSQFGSPAAFAKQPKKARASMKSIGRHFLSDEKIEQVLTSAQQTLGVPPTEGEVDYIKAVASEARALQKKCRALENKLKKEAGEHPAVKRMSEVIGLKSAAVLTFLVGDPREFKSAKSYEKHLGLNLKVKESGVQKGRLMITKKGSGMGRKYLCLAAWRLVQKEPLAAAWYEAKKKREGNKGMKGTVAVMRKLARALWHVARGERFEISKLFDENNRNLSGILKK